MWLFSCFVTLSNARVPGARPVFLTQKWDDVQCYQLFFKCSWFGNLSTLPLSSSFFQRKETPASLEHIWRRSTSCHTLSLFFFLLFFFVHNTFNLLQILSFPFCTHASNSFFSSFVLFPVLIEMPEAVSRLTPTMDAREKSLATTKL